ncbi:MAG TPA: hypothetical protein PKZ76_18720, partial [Xanthomonadaceae bacterium]|nr:hypothetical protein [Xanthomonadaceae bacterium]
MRDCEVRLLALLIGDGGLTGSSPVFTSGNPVLQRDFTEAVEAFGGMRVSERHSDGRTPSFAAVRDEEHTAQTRQCAAMELRSALAGSGMSARALAAASGVTAAAVTGWTPARISHHPPTADADTLAVARA